MEKKTGPEYVPEPLIKKTRPVFFTALFIFSWIYFGFLTLIYLLAIFYSRTITEVVNQYTPIHLHSKHKDLLLVLFCACLLHLFAFTGTILMWHRRRWGYYLIAITSLIAASYQLFQPEIAITTTGIYIILVVLFGIFYRR
ncbi:MAG: hypothetical protein M0P47_10050 [Bacteroidales bacterium]|jgi:hypothetical protein|nr:hypothetical protein [Bacteroidales bacterium]